MARYWCDLKLINGVWPAAMLTASALDMWLNISLYICLNTCLNIRLNIRLNACLNA